MDRSKFLKTLGAGAAVGVCPTLLANPDPYDDIRVINFYYKPGNEWGIAGLKRYVISDMLFPTFAHGGEASYTTFVGMKHKSRIGTISELIKRRVNEHRLMANNKREFFVAQTFCRQYPDLM